MPKFSIINPDNEVVNIVVANQQSDVVLPPNYTIRPTLTNDTLPRGAIQLRGIDIINKIPNDKLVTILNLTRTDPIVAVFWEKVRTATIIDPTDPDTLAACQYLISLNVGITQADIDAALS